MCWGRACRRVGSGQVWVGGHSTAQHTASMERWKEDIPPFPRPCLPDANLNLNLILALALALALALHP